jgi:flavin reductase (DIM6/NTAB) family NADH-FMN oxidoreductase RutF
MSHRFVCDRDVFRDVIGHFASGLTVITTLHDGARHGMTASAVSSLWRDPPMLVGCIHRIPAKATIERRAERSKAIHRRAFMVPGDPTPERSP